MKNQEKQYHETAVSILEQLYAKDLKDQVEGKNETWRYISTFVKRYVFYQEAESRLVFQPKKSPYPPKVEYRNDQNVLKPYLDITCKEGWPIWEIMVGPGFNQQVVYNSVVHFLEHAKIENGIETTDEYIQRILAYFQPYEEELKEFESYIELVKRLSNKETSKKIDRKDAPIVIGEYAKMIRREVCGNSSASNELREYLERNYFAKCGIIVSKSSIPYIFFH